MRACARVRAYMRVCVRVCVRERNKALRKRMFKYFDYDLSINVSAILAVSVDQ